MEQNKVLCLSGGGIKGISQLVVLAKIEEMTGQPISKLFSLIVGTSVGGLIASLLTIPKEEGSTEPCFSAKQALELFETEASSIFPKSFFSFGIFKHKYDAKPLEKLLEKHLGDNRLSDTTTRIIMTVNDKNTKDTELFDSMDKHSPHIRVKDVVRATTAAPTYFKGVFNEEAVSGYEYAAGTPYRYVDGGIAANRPGSIALMKMKEEISKSIEQKSSDLTQSEISNLIRAEHMNLLDNTLMCTMNFQSEVKVKESFLGDGILGFLATGGVSDLMKGSEINATKELEVDLRDGLIPITIPIPQGSTSLDNVKASNIAKLKKAAEEWIENNTKVLEELCVKLTNNSQIEEEVVDNIVSIDQLDNIQNDTELSDNTVDIEKDETDIVVTQWIDKLNSFWDLDNVGKEELLSILKNTLSNVQIQNLWNSLDFDLAKEIEYFVLNNLTEQEISQWMSIISGEEEDLEDVLNAQSVVGNFNSCSQDMRLEGDACYTIQDSVEVC